MAPSKKSKSAKKRLANLDDVSPDKEGGKSSQRKKKLSDKLGSQWSKEELERFYQAYRKYGKDWKKVAAVIRNRSIEMVEALYNMNRAYLSLPEGTASVVGLIAMMTDHYNVLEGSDSERESNDASGISRKPQKRRRGKEDLLQSQSITSSDGCLSLLKRRRLDGCGPHAVRKRTPRFPVSYSYKKDDREINVLINKRGRKSAVDANDDEVAHAAALTLTEASQRGGSPQVSQAPYRRTEQIKSSPVQGWKRMHPQSETAQAKLRYPLMDEDWLEGSIGSRGAENGDYARDTSSLMDMEGVGTVEIHRKGKKSYEKKVKVEDFGNNQYDDGGEACSGTEEGVSVSSLKGKVDIEFSNVKIEQLPPQGKRKRSKKLYFGDESSALDALQTLADMSLMMPASTIESESSVQLKEERTNLVRDDKSSVPEATSTSFHRGKIKLLGPKEKVLNAITRVEGTTSRKSKLGRDSALDIKVVSEAKQQPQSANTTWKRKRKSLVSKISITEAHMDSHLSEPMETEISDEEENRCVIKGKRTGLISAPSKQSKWVRGLEGSSFNSDHKGAVIDLALSTAQVPAANQVTLPIKHRSRRKMDLKSVLIPKEMKSSENMLKNRPSKKSSSLEDRALCLKEKLSCCLSSYFARRWCTFEWFYSAIDYPWFAKSEFVEYLNHVGLGHIPRLTRVEWGVIRSSLGKPRRFSEHFLLVERDKLKQYRESVRKHYTELRTGIREGLPTDLARPLSVGQRVIALHPKTREVYDGSVLTVDHDKCRVQFDRPELGVEFVMDIDCMPSNPLDNMPEALRRQNIALDKSSVISKELPGDTNRATLQAKGAVEIVSAQAAYNQPCTVAHIQAREADIRALSELTRALDKKEALLRELRYTNNDVLANQNDGDSFLRDSEPFKKHYATVLVQLKEASGQASSALLQLRQRNTYPGNPLPPWLKPPANSSVPGGPPSYLDDTLISQEIGSSVVEIVKGSRFKAHTMVDAAVQAMLSMKEGEDAFLRIGEALDSVDIHQLTSDSRGSLFRYPEHVNGSLGNHSQLISCTSEPSLGTRAPSPKLHNGSDQNEAQIPSELITSCVATLLMIQTCTERQFPPAEVAQILDSAVTSLHPCCTQNLPIYREIQMCMGRIKTQILALVPT